MADITVIDYGMGNLASVRRALAECGASVEIADTPDRLATARRLLLPGVGAFPDAMAHLERNGWVPAIRRAVANGLPLLGICLGMQLLMDDSTEGGTNHGLGLIPGTVRKLVPESGERIPHVGWNELHLKAPSPLTEGLEDRTDFYFVHSYHAEPADDGHVLATTPYAGNFVSLIRRDNVYGSQPHPEKSARGGFAMLGNFLAL